ncbi:MAG: hypothetical protein KY446_05385 [Proteobacteria bacterium]|nr:hypothetical protein [Pseudomonadota bacterium]MBW3617173.1 hypothetical protein [Pseudomonadota bacterium]
MARRTSAGWAGVLLTGRSEVGKSDLMLRLIEGGWSLVADDRVQLWASSGRLYAKAPPTLARLVEVRGVDVLAVGWRELTRVALVVHCVGSDIELDRIPDRARQTLAGVAVERTVLRPLEASAPAKVELALARALESRPGDADFLTPGASGV